MSKKTSMMSDIKKGKNLEKSLLAFSEDLAGIYGKSAVLNLSMDYAGYYEHTKENEADRSFAVLGKRINDLIGKIIAGKEYSGEDTEEIENIREEVKDRVDAATAFLSAFENFNYIISRKLSNKEDDGKEFDTDEETRKILAYIFEDNDNPAINSKIQLIISELPVRYTKAKFADIIENSIDRYAGTDKKALKAFTYMIRQAGMIYDRDKMKKLYPELADDFEYFKSFEFDKADEKQISAVSRKLNPLLKRCTNLVDEGIFLMDVVNNLYAVYLNLDRIDRDSAGAEFEILAYVNESFADEDMNLEEFYAKSDEIFTKLEGKQEGLCDDLMSYEGVLFYVQGRFGSEVDKFGYKARYDSLYKCSLLKRGSHFVELNDLEDSGIVEAEELNELKETLKAEFDRVFKEVDKSVRRGIMAQVIGSVPVYFENRTDVMEYVRSSLASCGSREELTGTINAITEIIGE